jgi:multisubunit Na+/H+ antiporter MnhB subunit
VTLLSALFDLLLLATLLWLAWRLLASADLFKAVVLFIAFGLLLALAWVRLNAPDVALAEAAIGAGITGALLMVALGRLSPEDACPRRLHPTLGQRLSAPLLISLAVPAAVVILLSSLLTFPETAAGLAPLVTGHLAQSEVAHPATAVLLNFRGYDTLLEVVVLILAVLGIWCLGEAQVFTLPGSVSPVLLGMIRVLLPVLVLTGGYLLWLGGHAPGGAFQAGALLAAGAVLWLFAGQMLSSRWSGLPLRLLLLGFQVFLAMAAIPVLQGNLLLAYPPGWAKTLILLVETLLAGSIAAVLAAAVIGGRPACAPQSFPPAGQADEEKQS